MDGWMDEGILGSSNCANVENGENNVSFQVSFQGCKSSFHGCSHSCKCGGNYEQALHQKYDQVVLQNYERVANVMASLTPVRPAPSDS